ncbi:MAG TPA: MauE/DoxX family redox-associated membrane protein [Bryobacteraceae bacterium]|nr:MauE/DoxX family redox-associated membrane protein [Bryobacteraceae bacterium]
MPATSDFPLSTRYEASEQRSSWKVNVAAVCAILLGIIYLVSGGWKILQPFQSGELLEQAQVPAGLGVLGASVLGTLEVFAAFLLFTRKFRRWGGLLGSALMIFFISWIGYHYNVLVGHECSCFPIIKRTVGPGFFISDAVFLLFGVLAFLWSPLVTTLKGMPLAFISLVVLAGASFGVNAAMRHNVQVPNPVVVNGKPADLTHGKVFLFFYDPECSHCLAAAKFMSTLNWGSTEIIGVPTHDPQFVKDFLGDTHLKADTSLETAKLRKAFPFVDPPFGVALDDGQVKETFEQTQFNEPLPAPDLKKFGFVK